MRDKPTITICGAMKHYPEMVTVAREYLCKGYNVNLPIPLYLASTSPAPASIDIVALKEKLVANHLVKIYESDEVYIMDLDSVIGDDTLAELEYGIEHNKRIIFHRRTNINTKRDPKFDPNDIMPDIKHKDSHLAWWSNLQYEGSDAPIDRPPEHIAFYDPVDSVSSQDLHAIPTTDIDKFSDCIDRIKDELDTGDCKTVVIDTLAEELRAGKHRRSNESTENSSDK